MSKTIKYIGFYDKLDSNAPRNCCLSAVNKMNYIIDCFNDIGVEVTVVSPSWFTTDVKRLSFQRTTILNKKNLLIQAPSFKTKSKIFGKLKSYFSLSWLFLYLLFNVKKEEEILVYHSLSLIKPILLAKKIKKFKIIYEIEEIYSDVITCRKNYRLYELNMFQQVEKYIFSTELLSEKINIYSKPEVIIYGSYHVESLQYNKFSKQKIHLVYSGTLEKRKGAIQAIKIGEFLGEKYHIHILGFGTDNEIMYINNLINEVSKKTQCSITYDGILKGEKYIRFLQSCDIGLCTQEINATFNNTSFPSKVLSYLSNGLRVVSVRIPSLEVSKVSDLLYFYDDNYEMRIAELIKKIDLNNQYNSKERIEKLGEKFKSNLLNLLEIKDVDNNR